jgi:hypothetical protein
LSFLHGARSCSRPLPSSHSPIASFTGSIVASTGAPASPLRILPSHFQPFSRLLYGTIHKPHHLWKLPTPFASHAFHPCDGVAQSMPCRPQLSFPKQLSVVNYNFLGTTFSLTCCHATRCLHPPRTLSAHAISVERS